MLYNPVKEISSIFWEIFWNIFRRHSFCREVFWFLPFAFFTLWLFPIFRQCSPSCAINKLSSWVMTWLRNAVMLRISVNMCQIEYAGAGLEEMVSVLACTPWHACVTSLTSVRKLPRKQLHLHIARALSYTQTHRHTDTHTHTHWSMPNTASMALPRSRAATTPPAQSEGTTHAQCPWMLSLPFFSTCDSLSILLFVCSWVQAKPAGLIRLVLVFCSRVLLVARPLGHLLGYAAHSTPTTHVQTMSAPGSRHCNH